ncbi:MAG: AroM family protein [Candidatus Rokubacteria bacterium]|nr:AroM family protein [Candidatus Rokubacteria bacterium]
MERIGMVTVGQAPRDDLVPFMTPFFTRPVDVLQAGALDGLGPAAIAALAPDAGEAGIAARLLDGSETLVSHAKLFPRVQQCADRLRAEGAELLVILCGADWSALRSDVLVVNPGLVFPAIVSALAAGRRLGVMKPVAGQIEGARRQFAERGIDAVVTSASPYTPRRYDDARRAAGELRRAGVDLVWMTCVGMDEAMRDVVTETTGKPAILARSILARVIDELLAAGRVPVPA